MGQMYMTESVKCRLLELLLRWQEFGFCYTWLLFWFGSISYQRKVPINLF